MAGEMWHDAMARMLAAFPQDEQGRMLHSPGLKAGGKFYAFATGGDVIVKLPEARVREVIAAGAGQPCSPRPGRPMRQWVQVSPADAEACVTVLREAREFVAGG